MAEEKKPTKPKSYPKLYRSETDKILGGVAGGLGEYFNIDPNIIRIIFILLAVFGGSGILIYLILWILLPKKSSSSEISEENIKNNVNEVREKAQQWAQNLRGASKRQDSQIWLGALFIIIGILFLLNNFNLLYYFSLERFWPLVLILLGLIILFRS